MNVEPLASSSSLPMTSLEGGRPRRKTGRKMRRSKFVRSLMRLGGKKAIKKRMTKKRMTRRR